MGINKVPHYLLNAELYPVPNSIPTRDEDGNMYTSEALKFKGENFEIPLIMQESGHLMSNNLSVWDSGNFPVEQGTFTAQVYGFGTERDGFNMNLNQCYYQRVGKLVHIKMRVQFGFNAKSGAPSSDQVRITGLPFSFPSYTCITLGFATGVNLKSSSRQLMAYIHPDGGIAFLAEDLGTTGTYQILSSPYFIKDGFTNPLIDIGLSFTGIIN